MKTLTIKLEPHQDAWLEKQARALKRSKGSVVRDLIESWRSRAKNETVGHTLRDLCGVFKGPRDLSTRPLKGYGRA